MQQIFVDNRESANCNGRTDGNTLTFAAYEFMIVFKMKRFIKGEGSRNIPLNSENVESEINVLYRENYEKQIKKRKK